MVLGVIFGAFIVSALVSPIPWQWQIASLCGIVAIVVAIAIARRSGA